MNILKSLVGSRTACEHVPDTIPAPAASTCQECGSGFSLRMCATCGHVGCCESQAGHARAHALEEGHPVIMYLPLSSGTTWCYEENAYVG